MSGILKTWVLGLCGVSLLTAAAQAAAGKGRYGGLLRAVGAVMAALVLLAPLRDGGTMLSESLAALRLQSGQQAQLAQLQAQAQEMTERRVEDYAVSLGAQMGILCTAQAQCESADGAFCLRELRIRFDGQADEAQRRTFIHALAQALSAHERCITEG